MFWVKIGFKILLSFFSLVDQAKAAFQNLTKIFSKKKSELKKANKSWNLRQAVKKVEQGFKAVAFLSKLDKHLQLRDTKSNFPKLPLEESNRDSFQQSAPSNHSTDGYSSSENEE